MSPARFNDGKTAKAHEVTLRWDADRLSIVGDDGSVLADWPLAEIRAMPIPHGGGDLRLAPGHGPGARLTITDAAEIQRARLLCPHLDRKAGRDPGWWKPYLGWGSAAVVSVVLIFTVIIPQMSAQLARLIPWSWEQALGAQVEPKLVTVFGGGDYCAGPGLDLLRDRVDRLAQVAGFGHPITLNVVESDIANAVALPGGRILVFSGLIDLAKDPNAVVAVLAHELGHVEGRHGMTGVIQSSATAALISLVLGDVTGGAAIAILTESLADASYSRDMEREADAFALAVMADAGWNARGLADLLASLEAQYGGGGSDAMDWLSSHPATTDRAEVIGAAAHAEGRALDAAEWQQVQALCH